MSNKKSWKSAGVSYHCIISKLTVSKFE